jgi:hypothetical protein
MIRIWNNSASTGTTTESIGSDRKGKLSVVVYINCAFIVFATAKDRMRLISADGYSVVNPRSTNRKTTY